MYFGLTKNVKWYIILDMKMRVLCEPFVKKAIHYMRVQWLLIMFYEIVHMKWFSDT